MNGPSNRALSDAIVVLHGEIERLTAQLEAGEVEDDVLEDTGEYVLQLQNSFGEFVAIYRERRGGQPTMLPLEKLLGKEVNEFM